MDQCTLDINTRECLLFCKEVYSFRVGRHVTRSTNSRRRGAEREEFWDRMEPKTEKNHGRETTGEEETQTTGRGKRNQSDKERCHVIRGEWNEGL